jgi:hypothetical protein
LSGLLAPIFFYEKILTELRLSTTYCCITSIESDAALDFVIFVRILDQVFDRLHSGTPGLVAQRLDLKQIFSNCPDSFLILEFRVKLFKER